MIRYFNVEERVCMKATNRTRMLVLLMCSIQFIDVLGVTLIIVALPSLSQDLAMSYSASSLAASIYALCFGVLLVPAGRIADIYGYRRMILIGITAFGCSSVLGSLAITGWVVIMARGIQGIAAAISVPAALALVTNTVTTSVARNRALGLWTAAGAVGGASGFALGGILTDQLGWRSLFLINLPIVAIALLLVPLVVAPSPSRPVFDRHPDLASVALLSAGLFSFIYGVSLFQDTGNVETLPLVLVGLGLTSIIIMLRRQHTVMHPLLPPSVLTNIQLRSASVVAASSTFVTSALGVLLTFWLQDDRNLGATSTGMLMMAISAGVILGSQFGSRLLVSQSSSRVISYGLTGIIVSIVGYLVSLSLGTIGGTTLAFLVMGVGLGISSVASTSLGLSMINRGDKGVASGVLSASAPIGTALGITVLTTISAWGTERFDSYLLGLQLAIAAAILPMAASLFIIRRHRRNDETQAPGIG